MIEEPLQGDIAIPDDQNLDEEDNSVETPEERTPQFEVKQRLTNVVVAGTSHVKEIHDIADEIEEGTCLILRREYDNKYDKNATGVYFDEQRVGYIPKGKNEIIANHLEADIPLRAVVTDASWRDNWFRIEVDVVIIDSQVKNKKYAWSNNRRYCREPF